MSMRSRINFEGLMKMWMDLSKIFCSLLLVMLVGTVKAEEKVTVYAAASLTNALSEISTQYQKGKPVNIAHSYAASSTLAKQIENGAPADIFISANTQWMDYLQEKGLVDSGSRVDLLSNGLVLITPKGRTFPVRFDKGFRLSQAFEGKLCTGDIDSVPAGIYARQALETLGWWETIKNRIVGTQDVRGALVFVERGECAAGIVYETDAIISGKVETTAIFPENTHNPILYPAALIKKAKKEAQDYLEYLKGSEASLVFAKHGFRPVNY
jgi:molybdate transport system substrate-binding protein